MTTITKDKKGNVLNAPADTTYHADGTGPRNSDGELIVDSADQGIASERTEGIKRAIGTATPSTASVATPATTAKTEA